MIRLPIDEVLPDLVEILKTHPSVVLEAPPGAGKSTRVPGAILDAGLTDQRIVMLEPRRLAARSLASRIASERNCRLGAEVGYHVRYDRKFGKDTQILVMTEGILTRQLQSDPLLEGVGVVILDEFHERSIHSDLALAFIKELMEVREDLRVVVMSATLGTETVAGFLDAKVVSSEGRLYPLEIEYVKRPPERLESGIGQAVRGLMQSPDDDGGDILVFLPSTAAIRRTESSLSLKDVAVMPLYGAMKPEAQDRVLAPSRKRKVVLATNIAETSLTIEGVTAVVDSGWVRRVYASKSSGFDELKEERISMASAKQRAGRAGRTAPGRVVRLWTTAEEHRFVDYDEPEVRRIDVTRPVLDCVAWSGRSAVEFDWFEAPRTDQIQRAESLLADLGALDEQALTALGHRMLKLPLHPRLGAILEYANDRGAGGLAAAACAVASEQDFVVGVSEGAPPVDSDVLVRCQLLDSAASGRSSVRGYQVHQGRARRVQQTAKRLQRFVERGRDDHEVVLKALAKGFPDRICFRRASNFAASGGDSVVVGRESRVDGDIIVAVVLFGADRKGNGIVRMASELSEAWLAEVFGDRLQDSVEVSWDPELNRVVARQVKRFGDLKYGERSASLKGADSEEVANLLVEKVMQTPDAALGDKAKLFVQRLVCAHLTKPELDFPNPESEAWPGLLAQVCYGKRGFADIQDAGFIKIIQANLSPGQRKSLEGEFPERIQVPSGSQMKIDYSDPERPVLAVRIQEVFGLTDTPTLGGGRLKVLMHLLAPNYRPAQITADLAGFWKSSYFDVRKDLRARYPKHAWPEDPQNAKPQKKGRSHSNK